MSAGAGIVLRLPERRGPQRMGGSRCRNESEGVSYIHQCARAVGDGASLADLIGPIVVEPDGEPMCPLCGADLERPAAGQ